MVGQTLGPLPPYWTIGRKEQLNLMLTLKQPLSGYLGGQPSTGRFIRKLTEDWKAEFLVDYAIPCNSASSGLMAACMAAGVGPGDEVWVSAYTMSATATCALILGANVRFLDVDPIYFYMASQNVAGAFQPPKAIIVTNLFGCAAPLFEMRAFCDHHHIVLIEDNAQAPYATLDGTYTGTIGHMGVFSLNVHKHIQCGEGGVVVTNDAFYACGLEAAINHGELAPHLQPAKHIGGNFRMTEPVAAIACAQLQKGFANVQTRIALADALTDIFRQVAFVETPAVRDGDRHAFYLWAGKITGDNAGYIRAALVQRVAARGVPLRVGYSTPLHRLFEGPVELPVVEELESQRLFTFEVCAYDPKQHHLTRMRDIILEEAETLEKEGRHDPKDRGQRGYRSPLDILGSA